MNIVERFHALGRRARPGTKFSKPLTKIIIHWIGAYPNQNVGDPWNWLENGNGVGVQASYHFIVKDKSVLQSLPLNEIGLHSGDIRNHESIGIGVIPMNAEGQFSKETEDTLRLLIKHIRDTTGIQLPLERHHDGTQKKDCPRYYTEINDQIGVDGRVANPPGGDERWKDLVLFLNDFDRAVS